MSALCLRNCVRSSATSAFLRSVGSEGGATLVSPRFGFLLPSSRKSTLVAPSSLSPRRRCSSAAAAVQSDDFQDHNDYTSSNENSHDPKHCVTCTCPENHLEHYTHGKHLRHFENQLVLYPTAARNQQQQQQGSPTTTTVTTPESQQQQQQPNKSIQNQINQNFNENDDDYPPPLPEPKVTFRRRVLPSHLVALSAHEGQTALQRALANQTAATYFMLTAHWDNQSDPASCGVTTLRQVLNAAGMDPTAVRWKGGWRYYGNDAMVVCRCMDPVRIQRAGITLLEFVRLAHCHGLDGRLERPDALREYNDSTSSSSTTASRVNTVQDFRNDVLHSLQIKPESLSYDPENPQHVLPPMFLVVSFSRAALQQTGDGHFSTVAAYDADSDSVLILDVARFKYPPYWVTVQELYDAMRPIDPATGESRGWSLWSRAGPWPAHLNPADGTITDEGPLPATWVPAFDETNDATCPLRPIQVQYCSTAWDRRHYHQTQQKGNHHDHKNHHHHNHADAEDDPHPTV